MKKLFLALAAVGGACLAGCSDNEEIGYDIGSKVLIPKNGLQQVALTADAAAIDYEVWIYRSGYNEGGSTAALSVDAEALAAYNKANGYGLRADARSLLRPPDRRRAARQQRPHREDRHSDRRLGDHGGQSLRAAVSVGSPDTEVNAAAATVLIFPVRPTTEKPENAQ